MEDPELALMYYLFRDHNITPGQYYAMPAGEKLLIQAFASEILERRAGM